MAIIDKSNLTMEELSMLNQEFTKRKKSSGTMWLLWFFLGGIGGHRFYLGETVMGIIYVVLAALALPTAFISLAASGILLLIDAFTNTARYNAANERIEQDIINELRQVKTAKANSAASANSGTPIAK